MGEGWGSNGSQCLPGDDSFMVVRGEGQVMVRIPVWERGKRVELARREGR